MAELSKLAVLIDGDNVRADAAGVLLAEIAKYGIASVKRIYGDWTLPNLKGWKELLAEHAIQPIQQFRYTTGKNATDGRMIIDAMDLLYTQRFDGFCLVSSDSDFTGLASRLRESGMTVYGFGEQKTPGSLVKACDKFIYLDVLMATELSATARAPGSSKTSSELKQDSKLVNLLRTTVDAASDEEGWAHLGAVGSLINKQAPDFDPRNYGFGKLSALVQATELFELDERKASDGKSKNLYLRDRRNPKT
ncbi:NYN domain-containing protein [Sinimarinibacterium sp. NLF-5-8]|uniref:NYN domain-containing protein n=1 Tax=Sinimarinibacterium sp. NLF-5-8 TaxID=2698684 RepID=UPI00137C102E|nr:NYN domain-containing protein [Sinimarinibacterium sp. NLF-5-8]QHS11125.1 NYN domain-containing protein [Sinimarinibacterium sp. NLF-5-8]